MNRRTFLKTAAGSASFFLAGPTPTFSADAAQVPDAELLAQAAERIVRNRQSTGVIVVRDPSGKPVRDARVRVEQVRHDFLFGCNFFRFDRIRDADREQQYRQKFAEVFNFATLPFYWSSYERQRGQPGYDYSEKTADWCRGQGLLCKGHPLVWDHPAGSPGWLPDDHGEIEKLSNSRVRDIVSRFQGRIDCWDVVNEATHLPNRVNQTRMAGWGSAVGPTRFTAEPLRIARSANPKATLLVNDYRVDPPYHKLLESLRDDGKLPFDAIGIQSHMHGGGWPLARLWRLGDEYAGFGVPIHFTETTIVSGPRRGPGENWQPTSPEGEEKQADYVPKFYTMLFAHPAMQAITWWDFSDDGAWQGAASGWVRKDMSPKPVYERMHDLIKKQWWTNVDGRTDADGRLNLTAYHGSHRVVVRDARGNETRRDILWRRGGPHRLEITLG